MNVKEFLKNNEIFTDVILADYVFFDHTEKERKMLDHEIGKLYGRCGLSEETPEDVHASVDYTLYKYEDKYKSIHKALTDTIDPTIIEIIEANTTSASNTTGESGGNSDTTNSERTYDDISMVEIAKDHSESKNNNKLNSSGTSQANSTRKRGLSYEDAQSLIRLHLQSLYDIIIEDVAKDLIIPVYIFEE